MLGFVMALALRYPKAFALARKILPYVGAIILFAGLFAAGAAWHSGKIEDARKSGFAAAELEYTRRVAEANQKTANMSIELRDMSLLLSGRTEAQQRELVKKIQGIKERVYYEVSSDPRYFDCSVSDRVFDDIQSQRAAVNSSIIASNPGEP